MQKDCRCATITVRDGWIICPVCGKGRTLRILPTTYARDAIVFCKRCGSESIINIQASASADVPAPDALRE